MSIVGDVLRAIGAERADDSSDNGDASRIDVAEEAALIKALHMLNYAALKDGKWARAERVIIEHIDYVNEIPADVDTKFDPHVHDAIATAQTAKPAGFIQRRARRGFRREDGSVICYPQVVVTE